MDVMIKWFQQASDKTPNTNPWHAFRLESPAALCGKINIRYGFDAVADNVPPDAKADKGCLTAITKAEKAAAKA